MNKNIKKIIASTIVCTAFSTLTPSTLSIGSQYAYAYSDDKITDLKIASGISGVAFYSSSSSKSDFKIKTGDKIPDIFYSTLSSNKSSIEFKTIQTEAADTRVFVGKSYVKLSDIYSQVNIEKGEKKSIYIRLYDSKNADDDSFTMEYQLVVEREDGGETETQSNDDAISLKEYGNIYLTNLSAFTDTQKFDLNFNKAQSIYNLNVPENISFITIKAVPEKETYKLRIDDEIVDTNGNDDDKNLEQVMLFKGKNVIKIRIISDDHETREYFLNITRGQAKTTTTTTTTTANNTTVGNTTSQSTQAGSGWQYRKTDGTLAIGWLSLGNDWYYFDSTGSLKTGWFKDSNGKWYFLNNSGAMAKNTVINGYKIGADGVYIAK